ncbi:hypothiocyanous acid reductase MerA [Mammaliicoccus lentus]|uniref:hypothiocyanous acid reductase MerA n=1 Tax=Mammaliicoccus lentus TaxID=42858 RepID=UPI0010729A43|nr:hypothiocyanous acid reductase MerA [Mammaliicoccus lentus]MBF0748628.1 FAD-dependent oxidoreductase [Mammaliicoccus lentus]TFU58619.1 dihydrolipoamide dehydrogenase [Mammaliicoccus lentus]
MKHYDMLVIGFGKAGKTLAKDFAGQGNQVAVVEQDSNMYGGTCINVGCIPSKTLLHEGNENHTFTEAINRKKDVVSALNKKNFDNLDSDENIKVYTYKAQFKDNETVDLLNKSNEIVESIQADHIIINTGSRSNIPEIEGIEQTENIYDSKGIMELRQLPEHLVIVGAGYIALEFATIFSSLGSKVSMIHNRKHILGTEDKDVASHIYEQLLNQGIEFIDEAEVHAFSTEDNRPVVHTNQGDISGDAVLLATGRIPNTDLALENTDINLGDKGEIKVNSSLETAVDNIYAVGDVKGGPQFTYISLDDYRIVKDQISGNKKRSTKNRGHVPYTVFLDPPLGRIGMTASKARKEGFNVKEGMIEVKNIPRHKVNNDDRGIFKAVVDVDSQQILGASLYGTGSEEIINVLKLAMDMDVPYTRLRDNIYTHPTMVEAFNDLFDI